MEKTIKREELLDVLKAINSSESFFKMLEVLQEKKITKSELVDILEGWENGKLDRCLEDYKEESQQLKNKIYIRVEEEIKKAQLLTSFMENNNASDNRNTQQAINKILDGIYSLLEGIDAIENNIATKEAFYETGKAIIPATYSVIKWAVNNMDKENI